MLTEFLGSTKKFSLILLYSTVTTQYSAITKVSVSECDSHPHHCTYHLPTKFPTQVPHQESYQLPVSYLVCTLYYVVLSFPVYIYNLQINYFKNKPQGDLNLDSMNWKPKR